jgi:hypothetical protein
MGCQYPFDEVPWGEIDDRFTAFAAKHPEFEHMAAIVKSVRSSGADTALAALTWMHDMIVVMRPISEPPFDAVAVRVPGSLHPPADGCVLIEHLSVTGQRPDRVDRQRSSSLVLARHD